MLLQLQAALEDAARAGADQDNSSLRAQAAQRLLAERAEAASHKLHIMRQRQATLCNELDFVQGAGLRIRHREVSCQTNRAVYSWRPGCTRSKPAQSMILLQMSMLMHAAQCYPAFPLLMASSARHDRHQATSVRSSRTDALHHLRFEDARRCRASDTDSHCILPLMLVYPEHKLIIMIWPWLSHTTAVWSCSRQAVS